MLKDAGDGVYTMFYWTLRGFVCASWVVRLAGKMNVSWVVVVRCKCECVGRQKGLCGSCVIRATSMHHIKSIRMFEDDVT